MCSSKRWKSRPVSRREQRIFLTYSTAAGIYSGLMLYFFTIFVNNVFTSHLGNLGYLATAGVLYLFLRKRLKLWASSAWRYLEGVKMKFHGLENEVVAAGTGRGVCPAPHCSADGGQGGFGFPAGAGTARRNSRGGSRRDRPGGDSGGFGAPGGRSDCGSPQPGSGNSK